MLDISTAGLGTKIPPISEPHRLWSLWEMYDRYAYFFVVFMVQLDHVVEMAQIQESQKPNQPYGDAPGLTNTLQAIEGIASDLQMESVKRQVASVQFYLKNGAARNLLVPVQELKNRIMEGLDSKYFVFGTNDSKTLFQQEKLFGEDVHKKFKAARDDIRNAGNCVAVRQPTACVMHLARALEAIVRPLGKRLGITVTPQTTWRQITGVMHDKIKKMPEVTTRQKHKREKWESAAINLHHVGSVWRNKTMHPAADYTESQARDILTAARVFTNDLCEL